MEVLWEESPLTAQDVAERIVPERAWSATTDKTLLGRRLAKQAIGHEADGRRYLYCPLLARDGPLAGESRRLIDSLLGVRLAPLDAPLVARAGRTRGAIDE